MNQTKVRNSPPLCKTNPVLLLDRRRRFPARRRRPKSLATSAVTLLSKSNKEQAQASEPQERKTRRKLLQVPGGSAPRELADLARLRQSLRTKMSPPLALTWSWAIFFFLRKRERACLNLLQARQSGSSTYILLAAFETMAGILYCLYSTEHSLACTVRSFHIFILNKQMCMYLWIENVCFI